MKKFYFFLVIILSLFVNTDVQAQSWLKGHWVGTGYQYTDGSAWSIDLEYNSKKNIKITYPSLACSGSFVRTSSNRHKVVFVEKILVGKDVCYDNSKVVITKIDKQYISIAYFLPEQFSGPVAIAVLERKKLEVKTVKKM